MTTEETPSADAESGTESNETYNLITQGIPDAFGFIVGKGYDILRSKAVWAGIIATSTLYAATSRISSYVNSGNINPKGIKSSVLEEVVLDEDGKKTKEKINVSYVSIPHEQAETGYVDFKLDENKNGTSLAYDQTQREVKLNKEHEKAQETAENNYKSNQKIMTGSSDEADEAFGWDVKPTKPVKTKNKSNHNDHQRLNETDTRLNKSEGNESK